MLKSQDIFVLLKLVVMGRKVWSYAGLAVELRMSPSQVHGAVKRCVAAHLAVRQEKGIVPHFRNLQEFILHGLRYVFWPVRGGLTRGVPTAHAAPPLSLLIVESSSEPPPVWPDPEGEIRGIAFSPLYKLAPQAARTDEKLYEMLALVDAIRSGRAREREIAAHELSTRLERYASTH